MENVFVFQHAVPFFPFFKSFSTSLFSLRISLKKAIAAWIELTIVAVRKTYSKGKLACKIESAVKIPDIVVKKANPELARILIHLMFSPRLSNIL